MNLRPYILAATLFACIGTASAANWNMDPTASRLEFIITYERQAASAEFKKFDTRLSQFNPERPDGGRLNVTIATASADFASAEINEAIREPEWFHMALFQQAEFKSSDIRRTAPDRYVARGMLSLKGVAREIEVPFTWSAAGDTATMEGALSLDRTTFGIGTGEWATGDVIGLGVQVKFKVLLRRIA